MRAADLLRLGGPRKAKVALGLDEALVVWTPEFDLPK